MADTDETTPKPPETPIGRSGTINTQGYITDQEMNRLLVWPQNLAVFETMRRTDPTIRWMLALVETPIRAAQWTCEPATADDQDREIAAFVEHNLFRCMDDGWDGFLRQCLNYLAFGHQVFEIVAEFCPCSFSYMKEEVVLPAIPSVLGGPVPVITNKEMPVDKECFCIDRLAPRLPQTIIRWVKDPTDSAELKEIEQQFEDGEAPSSVMIPADRLVIFTNEKEGDDWRGTSLLRSAYKSWKTKTKLENLEAIAYERSAGMPIVYPPRNVDDGQLDSVEQAVKKLRQGESLWLIMPGPKASPQEPDGWLVDDFAMQGDAGADPDKAIQRYETAMARNVLAEFMRLGHERMSGARATGEVQQDPYYQAIEAQVTYIEEVVNEQVVKKLVDWNYETDRYPRVMASKIQAKNLQIVSNAIAVLMNAGAIQPSPEIEVALREMLDIPQRPSDEETARVEAEAKAAGLYAPPGGFGNGTGPDGKAGKSGVSNRQKKPSKGLGGGSGGSEESPDAGGSGGKSGPKPEGESLVE